MQDTGFINSTSTNPNSGSAVFARALGGVTEADR